MDDMVHLVMVCTSSGTAGVNVNEKVLHYFIWGSFTIIL